MEQALIGTQNGALGALCSAGPFRGYGRPIHLTSKLTVWIGIRKSKLPIKYSKVIATADELGRIKLFQYPCPVEKAAFHHYVGHSSGVTSVRFSSSNNYLISTGGKDKAIFQWKYQHQQPNENCLIENVENLDDDENIRSPYKFEEMSATQFGASKPFLGEVKASTPKDFIPAKDSSEAPKEGLKLKYIHGYRGFDTKDNVKFTSTGNIIFHSAAADIVMNVNDNTQTFFTGHDEDIVSLSIHPNVTRIII